MRRSHLTAKEAAAELGVRLATLYAYVSRGLIRSEAGPGRSRRYAREDVERLKRRREARREPGKALDRALHFGAPLLESAITLIDGGRLYYRGRDAVELSRTARLEEVAELVWGVEVGGGTATLFAGDGATGGPEALRRRLAPLPVMARLQALLPIHAAEDPAAWDLRPAAVARTGARLLRALVEVVASRSAQEGGLVPALAAGWGCEGVAAEGLLGAALILAVDHELNVSSFTARCVASAGSTPYAAVGAGLAAIQGIHHGGHSERMEALLAEAGAARGDPNVEVPATIAGRLRRGEPVPGFGHRLYPGGDPRCRELFRRVAADFPGTEAAAFAAALESAGRDLLGEHPNVDAGLAVTARALGLPRGSALVIFALGRTVGWIGHALEQYREGRLIRPRARYVGERPEGAG